MTKAIERLVGYGTVGNHVKWKKQELQQLQASEYSEDSNFQYEKFRFI